MKSRSNINRAMLLLMVALFAFIANSFAQTLKDLFGDSQTPLFYLGIDFTQAKLIDDATANARDIKERQYAGINDVVITETKKYDLSGAFRKNNIDHDLGPVAKRNATINADNILSTNTSDYSRLKPTDIDAVVKSYDLGDKKGVGLLFVMEAMSKSGKGAAMWVTLLDMKTKKVLMTERMEGKTGMSFGFRNFWVTPVKSVIDEIDKKKYKEWKAKYAS